MERDWSPVSPSGDFQAIVGNQVAQAGPLKGTKVWQVSMKNAEGEIVYIEQESMRPWHLNNYWAWDTRDRFWVYDSDVQLCIVWELGEEGWSRSFAEVTDEAPESLKRFSK